VEKLRTQKVAFEELIILDENHDPRPPPLATANWLYRAKAKKPAFPIASFWTGYIASMINKNYS
jgi:hypothetical protein